MSILPNRKAERTMATTLSIQAITRDVQCQPRAYLIPDVIDQYAEEMSEGSIFPPVVVFREADTYWLADSFHRVAACERAGVYVVRCEIREGTIRDAMLYSLGANATHGLRRTNHDKRQAVETLLDDPEWSQWSNVKIAKTCAVHQSFVARMRESLSPSESEQINERTYTDRWGNEGIMNTANIGKRPDTPPSQVISVQTEPISVEPPMSIDPGPAMADVLAARSTPTPVGALDADDEEFEEYDRPPSTPEQCQAVVTDLEALLLTLQRPEDDGHEHVMLTEVIEYLTAHADADDQKWMLTELGKLYVNMTLASGARVEALAALRAMAA